ncbi:hypothetical protein EG68_01691 [Paragonimus skrjabini miyazakii]|uniref:Uncharacterized protein n=1 Tax=Paragonimus skrjabini miyazakii TaxID=59628 RepID=A0A8S9Z7V4_9TREM|nr:hypothetical protein EG68_01691 [Paragonimus skrjabini miyazakii]
MMQDYMIESKMRCIAEEIEITSWSTKTELDVIATGTEIVEEDMTGVRITIVPDLGLVRPALS